METWINCLFAFLWKTDLESLLKLRWVVLILLPQSTFTTTPRTVMRFASAFLFTATIAKGNSLMTWLLSDDVSSELSMTHDLASKMDRNRLEGLAAEAAGGLVLVVPTNEAWLQHVELYEALMHDTPQSNKLRTDVMFAAGGEMDSVGGFDALLAYAEQNDGVVDTAFGTPMKIETDGRVCLAEYDTDWELVTSECATLRLPPLMFDDGALYFTDNIILPDVLWSEAGVSNTD